MTDVASQTLPTVAIPHIIKGRTVLGDEARYGAFATPALDIDAVVWPRSEPGPAFSTPISEIMDLLVATGERMKADPSGVMRTAFETMAATGDLDRGVVERAYQHLPHLFARDWLEFLVEGLELVGTGPSYAVVGSVDGPTSVPCGTRSSYCESGPRE